MHDFFVSLMLLGAFSADEAVSPYWMTAGQWGTMPEGRGAVALVQAGTQFDESKTFQWRWGLSVGALGDTPSWNFPSKVRPVADEAFVAIKWKFLSLEGGMARRQMDFLAPADRSLTSASNLGSLSTTGGNMIFSGNAPTMPGYTARVHPVSIPGTKDHLKLMARFGDYWTIDQRYVMGAMVHNTSFGARIGLDRKNNLGLTLAVDHYSMWGGTDPELGPRPSDFKNYCRIIVGASAPAATDGYTVSDVVNVIGNHLGHYLLRLDYKGSGWSLALQHDHPYEDKGGMLLRNMPDGVNTVAFSFDRKDRWVTDVVYEFTFTRWQGGTCERRPATEQEVALHTDPRLYKEDNGEWSLITGGSDDYFINYEYKSGWTHGGYTIGDPLISLRNNRVVAHHVGLGGKLFRKLPYRFLLTWSRNYGRYRETLLGNEVYGLEYRQTLVDVVHELSGGFQCEVPLCHSQLYLVPAIWWDCGALRPDRNVAGTLGIRYIFSK